MLKISWPKWLFKYCKNDSSGKWSDPGNFLKARFVIVRCQKYVKKEYIEMTKKNLPWDIKECPRLLHFPLLLSINQHS